MPRSDLETSLEIDNLFADLVTPRPARPVEAVATAIQVRLFGHQYS